MRTLSSRRILASAVTTLSLLTGLSLNAQAGKPFISPSTPATPPTRLQTVRTFARLPLGFEQNRGQTDSAVQFLARTPESTVYLAGSDAVLQTFAFSKDNHGMVKVESSASVRMHLLGAAIAPTASTGDTLPGTANYLRGNNRSKWQTAVPEYRSVQLASVYPGVDLKYYGQGQTLEYDFVVAPNKDASQIHLQFHGSTARMAEDGDLLLPTANGRELRFAKPVAYQQINGARVPVQAEFQLAANHDVTFKLGSYDRSRELVIDPTLVYLGTLGAGAANETVSQIAVDSSGALYFIGTTADAAFPTTAGSYQTVCGPANATYAATGAVYCPGGNGGPTSAFITKLSADGTQLVYSTYLSGHGGTESGTSITVDSAGVAFLLGTTGSDDFPVTADAYQKNCIAYYGVFGGPNVVKCDGNYNGGGTEYTIGNQPAFFSKLSANGTSLLYSSFLGGTQPVYPNTIALDGSGNIYLSGQVRAFSAASLAPCANGYNQGCQPQVQFDGITSSGYMTVSSATNINGNSTDISATAFLSKFSNDGHTLLYGTFFGDNTSGLDVNPTTMAVGANGVAFLGGYTASANYPTTTGAIKTACTQPGSGYGSCNTYDGYVAAIDTTKAGTASLAYSTRLGGVTPTQNSNSAEQEVLGMTADSSNDLFVTGYTFDHTFQMATGGYQATCPNYNPNDTTDRCDSAFLLKLNPTGTAILKGTFLGGPDPRSAESVGFNVRLDSKGQVYLYGRSNDGGGDFPQVNPLQTYKGGNQLFISTFSADLSKLLFSTRFGNPSYPDHSVTVAGGMVLDAKDNIYFAGSTSDAAFAGTTGTHNDSTGGTGGTFPRIFFAKLSKVLQPDTTVLTITPNPVNQGNTVSYKAVVTGIYQTTPAATGTVTFSATNTTPATVLGTATLDVSGTATLTQAAPAIAGTYMVVASYGADANYDVSTSSSVTLNVTNLTATTTTLAASPSSTTTGQTVTLMATVVGSGGTPSGTVTFLDGSTALGMANLSGGSATFTTMGLSVATHAITARYSGDTTFSGSTSSAQTVTVSTNTVAIGLTALPSVIVPGASATLTATLSGATSSTAPTGKITFYSGNTSLGAVNVANNSATLMTTALPLGTDNITAVYSGDGLYGAVTSSAQTILVRAAAATTTTLASSAASVSSGSSVTFTATVASAVTSGTPSGTVTFFDGTTSMGIGTVSNGTATYTTSSLTVATHSITAVYSGDGLFLGSTSTAFSQTVVFATISLSASPTSLTITHGSSGTATITVTPMGAYSGSLSFSCGTLPTYASCAFSPATLTFSASATAQATTLTINTKSTTSAMLRSGEGVNGKIDRTQVVAAAFFLPLGLLGLAARRRGSVLRAGLLMLTIALSLGAIGLSGCGGSSTPTVAAGTYTVPVVATVNGSTTTLNLSITVQ